MNPLESKSNRGQEGIAIIYVAVFLLVSLWFVSLAIDVGKLMAAKTELQAAADAAALAGVSAINPDTGIVDQDVARTRAAATAGANKALEGVKTPVVIDPVGDVEFPTAQQVKVTVHRTEATGNPVILHFAQTLGIPHMDVQANATAEAQTLSSVCEGVAPFAPQQPPAGVPFSTDCNAVYNLKVGNGGAQQGNFQLLDFPDCNEDDFNGSGAAAIRYYTINGYDCCLDIGEEFVWTEPGNKVGPFRQALQTRWDMDTDRTHSCYQDYTGNDSRVFITPIIESFDVNGNKMVRINGFAAFFLKARPVGNQDVPGQFIKFVAPGNPGVANTGIYGVHLVE
jgi:Flp pilus assembly protein TadG